MSNSPALLTIPENFKRSFALIRANSQSLSLLAAPSALFAGVEYVASKQSETAAFPVRLAALLYMIWASVVTVKLMADGLKRPTQKASLTEASQDFTLVMRYTHLAFHISIFTFLWSLLLIIPGIVYLLYAALASTLLIVENLSVPDALIKSKQLLSKREVPGQESNLIRVLLLCLVVLLLGLPLQVILGATAVLLTGLNSSILESIVAGMSEVLRFFFGVFWSATLLHFYLDLRRTQQGNEPATV